MTRGHCYHCTALSVLFSSLCLACIVTFTGCFGSSSSPTDVPEKQPSEISNTPGQDNRTPDQPLIAPVTPEIPSKNADQSPPYVTATSPSIGETISSDKFSSTLSFTLSEDLAASSITDKSVYLTDTSKNIVAGTVALDSNETSILFSPSAPLRDSETYTVSLETGITDSSGNPLTYPYTYNFMTGATKTVAVAAGANSFLALKENGTVWGWGQNNDGQIGDGTQIDRNKPTRTLITDTIAVAAGGRFGMALCKDGTVWTWGDNSDGQLGDGTTTSRLQPAPVPNFSNVKAISAGNGSAYALKKDNTLWAWGLNNSGQLGIGTTGDDPQTIPVQVQGISGTIVSIISASTSAAALVRSDPADPSSTSIWAWGDNYYGQLGNGISNNSNMPVQANVNGAPLTNVAAISYGGATLAAITASGDLYLWGSNRYGQIGNPDLSTGSSSSISLTPYLAMNKVKSVHMGPFSRSTYAVRQDDTLWGWGDDTFGQLAIVIDGGIRKTPFQLGTISNMEAISSTRQSAIFLRKDGTVWTTGYRVNGQLGDGSADYASYRPYYLSNVQTPVSSSGMLSPTGWSGKDNMVTAAPDGTVWAWGSNQHCELGIAGKSGQTQPILAPTQVAPTILKDIAEVSRGAYHVLARDINGNVWAWGDNSYGQLGNNQQSPVPACTPTKVLDTSGSGVLSGITSISTGFLNSFAIRKDPITGKTTVYAWGLNSRGNLGLGFSSSPKLLPTVNTLLPDDIKKISSGSPHELALTESGEIYGWGPNSQYQVGNGTNTDVNAPTRIIASGDGNIGQASDVCTGAYTSFAVRSDGTVVAWGLNPSTEPLGIAANTWLVAQPTPVQNISGVVKIACSGSRTNLALTSEGLLWSWGSNYIGNMGMGNTINYNQPQQVPGPGGIGLFRDVVDISYAMAIRKDGTVWQFGYLPDGSPDHVSHLVQVVWP